MTVEAKITWHKLSEEGPPKHPVVLVANEFGVVCLAYYDNPTTYYVSLYGKTLSHPNNKVFFVEQNDEIIEIEVEYWAYLPKAPTNYRRK